MHQAKLSFVDFEASSLDLDSWPVEAAILATWGQADAFLIRRHPSWSMRAWDRRSANIHGIALADLQESGLEWAAGLERLGRIAQGHPVFSDAAEFDQHWLDRLAAAAGQVAPFQIRDWHEALPSDLKPRAWRLIRAEAGMLAPRAHRAAADTKFMMEVWRLAWEAAQ